MTHSHRAGEVSARAPHSSSRALYALWVARSLGVCLMGCVWRWQTVAGSMRAVPQGTQQRRAQAVLELPIRGHATKGKPRSTRADWGKCHVPHGIAADSLPPSCSSPQHSQQPHSIHHCCIAAPFLRFIRPHREAQGIQCFRHPRAIVRIRCEATEDRSRTAGAAVRFHCCSLSNEERRTQRHLSSIHY